MKIAAILLVLCAVAVSNVSGKKENCFNIGPMYKDFTILRKKGNASPQEVRETIKKYTVNKSQEPAIDKCLEDCKPTSKDFGSTSKCACAKLKPLCPDIVTIEKLITKGPKG